MNKQEIDKIRMYSVVKHNDLIQRSCYELSNQEQKIIMYLISKIKRGDIEFKMHEFKITDFCQICGIDANNGLNYTDFKDVIKNLADKSRWIKIDKTEKLFRWIDYVEIVQGSGTVKIKLSELIQPFLLDITENFTEYEYYYILAMDSKYSIRLYEILRSYEFIGRYTFSLQELKKRLNAQKYELYKDFRVRVLDPSVKEINNFGDICVSYEVEKDGRKVDKITFDIRLKNDNKEKLERPQTWKKIEEKLNKKQKRRR